MQVLYDHGIFSTQARGGISRYFLELVPRLSVEGVEPCVFAGFHRNEWLRRPAEGARRYAGRYVGGTRLATCRGLANQLLFRGIAAAWRCDVYHPTYYGLPGWDFRFRGPTVVTVYDLIHERFPASFRSDDPTVPMKRRMIARADAILAISRCTADDLEMIYGVSKHKIRVVPLAASPAPAGEPDEAIGIDRPFLLHVGARAGYKNFSCVLEALARTRGPARDLAVVSVHSEPFDAEERARIARLGLEGRAVNCTAGRKKLATLYRRAVALVVPSRYEGFGLPVLEAMQHGCPVLAASAGALPEVGGEGAAYFDPERSDDLSALVMRAVDDAAFRSGLTRRGAERARHYSWARCARETAEVYRALGP